MLTTIKAHLDSIGSTGQYATLQQTDGLAFAPGLTDIKKNLLALTQDKEVGAVLVYDPEKEVIEARDIVHGSESSCNILFPDDASKLGNKVVIGDVHTHPPTKYHKKTVYLAPSFEDLIAASERFVENTGINKFYMMSLVISANEVWVLLVNSPLRQNDLVTYFKGRNLHEQHMNEAKVYALDEVIGLNLITLYDALNDQQEALAPSNTPNWQKKFWRAKVEGNTMNGIVDIIREGAPGYSQMIYETSMAQCVNMIEGTSLTLLRGPWNTNRLTKVQFQRTPQQIMNAYKNVLLASSAAKQNSVYKAINNPTKGMFYSPSVGLRCCQCLKVHQWTFSTVWGRWHKCKSCHSVFCANCGDKLPWKSTFSRGRQCRYFSTCAGETELLS